MLPIRRPGYSHNAPSLMTCIGDGWFVTSVGNLPHLHRLILAGRGNTCAIRGPRNLSDHVGMTRIHISLSNCSGVPYVYSCITKSTVDIPPSRGNVKTIGRPGSSKDLIFMTRISIDRFIFRRDRRCCRFRGWSRLFSSFWPLVRQHQRQNTSSSAEGGQSKQTENCTSRGTWHRWLRRER